MAPEAAPEQDTAPEPSDTTTDSVQQHTLANESPDDPVDHLKGGAADE